MVSGMISKKNILFLAVCCLAMVSCQTYRAGDLLFHVASKGNAITDVTPGMIDHVAIVVSKDSVIEAVGRGVKTTPIDSLRRQEGYYLIGKVIGADRKASINQARQYIGRAYDPLFLKDNEDIYCSELVQFSFVDNQGKTIFTPIPMSFHDATGNITEYWKTFYEKRGLDVPEGEPGTNPSELSQRENVKITGRLR
jgi:hypothetical protein